VSLSRDVARVRRLAPQQRRLLIEAVVWLGLLRAAIAALPYRQVASLLRLTPSDPSGASRARAPAADDRAGSRPRDAGAAGSQGAEAIGWAVRGAAARTPWLSTCLVQSLAGSAMLRRRGLPGVVYLGVAKDPGGEIIAHSWLRCGDRFLTGAAGYQRYSVIAVYRPMAGARRCGR
jgi:hypothetical protein